MGQQWLTEGSGAGRGARLAAQARLGFAFRRHSIAALTSSDTAMHGAATPAGAAGETQ